MTISKRVQRIKDKIKKNPHYLAASFVCLFFLIAYLTLSLVKHAYFGTGYDLSVDNQIVWEYSRFLPPIMTVHAYAFTPVFYDHVEFIYALIAPFYWLLPDARMLIILQVVAVILSGFAVYLLAIKHKINIFVSLALLISYFTFFGIQNAIWSDVHSLVFGICFLAFFIYFLDSKRKWLAILFFILALTSKEDIGLLTFFISFVYFVKTREKINIFIMAVSVIYSLIVFYVFYPYFTIGYQYANESGLLSNLNLANFANTAEKRSVFLYSFTSFGFLPLLSPLYLIPYLADLGHYFVLGNERVTSAQGLFGHYRMTSSLLLVWPTIFAIEKFKKLNNKYFAVYILFFAALTTYFLHAPLTYLTKEWFWTKPSGVNNINMAINYLPKDAYIATQTNIAPHVSSRRFIVTMWGERKDFEEDSPCGERTCAWFKWAGEPDYLIVDTSTEWDIRHLLANRPDFIEGLENMEKYGKITLEKEFGSSKIYKVNY